MKQQVIFSTAFTLLYKRASTSPVEPLPTNGSLVNNHNKQMKCFRFSLPSGAKPENISSALSKVYMTMTMTTTIKRP